MKRLTPYLLILLASLAPSFSAASDLDDLAKHRWIRVDSPHFSVITEQSEQHGRQVVQDLETMRYFMQAVVGIRLLPSARPLPILAVGDMGAFRLLGFPKNWGGVFSLSLSGYSAVANIDNYAGESKTDNRSRATVLHEYHHFLMSLTEETQAMRHGALPKDGAAAQALAKRFPEDARLLSYRGDYLRRQAEFTAATRLDADVTALLKEARGYYRRAIKSDTEY